MRKTIMIAACLVSIPVSMALANGRWDNWNGWSVGDPPAVKSPNRLEWAWDGGREAGIALPATIHYQQGGAPRVIVTGPADLLAHVLYHQGRLKMDNDFRRFDSSQRLEVLLTGMGLDRLAVAGSGDIHMGELHQPKLALSVSGSGSVEAGGRVEDFSLSIAGSGKGHLDKLSAGNMDISIAGSGSLDAPVVEEANISVVGSGNVHFHRLPKELSTSILGSGRISDDEGHVIQHNNRHGRTP